MNRLIMHPGIMAWWVLLLMTLPACRQSAKAPQKASQESYVLAPEIRILETCIARRQWNDRDSLARAITHLLDTRYTYDKDSFTHATLALLRARVYQTGEDDSLLYYLTDADYFFSRHPARFRERVILFSRLTDYYMSVLGQQIPTNFYFSRVGIELRQAPEDSFSRAERAVRYTEIASSNRSAQLYKEAGFYIQLALKYGKSLQEEQPALVGRIYQEAITTYGEQEEKDSSRLYLALLDELMRRYPDKFDQHALDYLNLKASYYYGRQQFDSALVYCYKIIALKDADPGKLSPKELAPEYFNIGEVLTRLGRYREASGYLNRASDILLPDTTAWLSDIMMLRENRLRYYIRAGDLRKAADELEAYNKKVKEFYNQERLRVMEELETQYQVKDREKHIYQLNLEKKQVSDQLERKNLLLLSSILVMLLAGALLVILMVLLRQRRILAANEKIILEQQLLRSQMEPHFIFNTLSVLQHMIRQKETDLANRYLGSFAGLLRRSLENSRESLVSLEDEVKALEDYLVLQQLRFERKFTYELTIYNGYEEEELMIPPMLLQPFIENAIEHGFRGMESGGIIKISIQKQGTVLECVIADNGMGMAHSPIVEGKRSLAGTITRERLAILEKKTRQPAGLTIIDKHTQGSRGVLVRIVIPYQ